MMRAYYDPHPARAVVVDRLDRLETGEREEAHEEELLLPSSPPRVEVRAPVTSIGMPVPVPAAARVEQTGAVSKVVHFRGSRYASGGTGAKRYQRQHQEQ